MPNSVQLAHSLLNFLGTLMSLHPSYRHTLPTLQPRPSYLPLSQQEHNLQGGLPSLKLQAHLPSLETQFV